LETYGETNESLRDESGVHSLSEGVMSNRLLASNYVKEEKNFNETIDEETERLKKDMKEEIELIIDHFPTVVFILRRQIQNRMKLLRMASCFFT
jgi:hypothetical protein